MKFFVASLLCFFCWNPGLSHGREGFETDIIPTADAELKITFIGHATLFVEYSGKVIHIDPWTNLADYSKLPKADLILITHEHQDHFDKKAIEQLTKEKTEIVCTETLAKELSDTKVRILRNNESTEVDGILIEAIPSYNILHKRPDGKPFHPKGRGNGYILNIAGKRILIGGDTENTVELKKLENIDIAFLPMNLPYTMTPEMVAEVAIAIKAKILYPYHFGETDTGKLVKLLKNHSEIEIRIRKMQ